MRRGYLLHDYRERRQVKRNPFRGIDAGVLKSLKIRAELEFLYNLWGLGTE
jgi:hypothetical protein